MSERPDTLDRLVDALDVGMPPVPEIVARGAIRARRRQRVAIAVAAATIVVTVGGAATLRPSADEGPAPTSGRTELPVRIDYPGWLPAMDGLPAGHAAWSPEQETMWVPVTSGGCGLRATADLSGSRVRIVVDPVEGVCPANLLIAAVVVGGVDKEPSSVAVVGHGTTVAYAVKEVRAADEVGLHSGAACPGQLPLGEDRDGHGFGVTAPATRAPELPGPERAWVCRYTYRTVGRGPDGAPFRAWTRRAPAVPVPIGSLGSLAELAPYDASDRLCTEELGSRWLLVLAHGTDLTGAVIDDFGCQVVRLTDEPFRAPPGEAWQPGTVPGVLAAPEGLLDAIRSAAEAPSNR